MSESLLTFRYVGGPTAVLEWGGLRLLTDPTFDPAGTDYPTPVYTLHKDQAPGVSPGAIGHVDAVLLSHDHHLDNLDHAGRALLPSAECILTTHAGAERLGSNAIGLAPWESVELPAPDGRTLRVTGTPARHGPEGGDRGPVIGFVLAFTDALERAVYVSGDTVWYEGVAEVARRFSVRAAILFVGAARVREVGPAHLTMTAEEGVLAAQAMPDAVILPVHYEGWRHFSESSSEIDSAFAAAGLADRLRRTAPGGRVMVPM